MLFIVAIAIYRIRIYYLNFLFNSSFNTFRTGYVFKILKKAQKEEIISPIFCTKTVDSPQLDTIMHDFFKRKQPSVMLYPIVSYRNQLNQFQFFKFLTDLNLEKDFPPASACFIPELGT